MNSRTLADLKQQLLAYNIFEQNNFFENYCNLIFNNILTKKEKFKTQRHHSIPVCYYRYKCGLTSSIEARKVANEDNGNPQVNLSYADHILAHYFLSLCLKEPIAAAAAMAFIYMTKTRPEAFDTESLPEYQKLYEKSSKFIGQTRSGKPRSEATKEKLRQANLGKTATEATREKIGEASRGRHWTAVQRQKFHENVAGTRGGYNNVSSKQVICIETQQIFGSTREAARIMFNKDSGQVGMNCRGKQCAVHGYHFAYIEDAARQRDLAQFVGQPAFSDKSGIERCAQAAKKGTKAVLCLNTGEQFSSLKEVCDKYDVKYANLSAHLNRHTAFITTNIGPIQFTKTKGAER